MSCFAVGTDGCAEAGALAAKVAKEWRDFNPDMVDHYKKWAKDLG